MVTLLIKHGADVNASTNEGTPLHFAVKNYKPWALKMLLSKEVKLETKDFAQRTAMMLAVQKQRHDLVAMLLAAGAALDRSVFTKEADVRFLRELEDEGVIVKTPPQWSGGEGMRRESLNSRKSARSISSIFRRSRAGS